MNLTGNGRQFTDECPYKCSLAGAIWPDQANAIPAQQFQVSHLEQYFRLAAFLFLALCPSTIAYREFMGRKHKRSAIGHGSKLEVQFRKILRTLHPLQTVQQFLAAPSLSTTLPGFVATNKFFGMRDMLLLRFVLAHTPFHPLLTQVEVFSIVAGILFNPSKC